MFAIAIDGPAGAGKSSTARATAAALGFTYVDTGALYRAIALYMLERGVNLEDPAEMEALLPQIEVSIQHSPQGQRTLLGGRDVSEKIRTQEVSITTSRWVSRSPAVRAFLLDLQRELARKSNVVMDGRDIGSVILPGAQLKIFLTASPEERAARRTRQLKAAGEPAAFDQVLQEIVQRDRQDQEQLSVVSPEAVTVDTTGMTFDQVVERLAGLARERMAQDESLQKTI